jgi:heme A synthase
MLSPFSDVDPERSAKLLPRWARWIVLFIAPTLLAGLLFATNDVLFARRVAGPSQQRFQRAMHDFKDPYWNTIKLRFVLGALVGAGVGSACIAWCIMKREEP